ncbi:MAG: Npt1/Npt2 family nucleotide transporter [Vicinamibacteria bacterium]
MARALERLLRLQRGDLPRGLLLFGYLLCVVCAYVVGQVARDALFLGRFDASRLPYVDVTLFLLVGVVVAVYVRLGRDHSLDRLLVSSLVLFGASGIVFAALARGSAPAWLFPVVYVWVGIFGVLAPAQVWTLANWVLTPREARRLFGFVGAGATLGATIAGFACQVITRRYGAESLLLLVSALLLVAPLFVLRLWARRPAREASTSATRADAAAASLRGSLRVVLASKHLQAVAGIVLLSSFVTALSGWQMKAIAQQALGGKDALAGFFGSFNAWVGALCLVTQLSFTSGILRRLGLGNTLLLLPIALLAGSSGLLAFGSLAAAVFMRGSDKVLRYSVDRPAVELLYLPVPSAAKLAAKSFIDTVVWRAGDGLAGLAVLALATFGGMGPVPMTLVNIPLLVAWLVLAARVHGRYVSTLEETLQQHRLDAERADRPVVDRETEEVLAARLGASDPQEILYALDLMALGRNAAAHPAVRGLLDHPVAEVRARALRILGEAEERSVLPKAELLLHDPAAEVRTEALLYLARHSDVDPVARVQDLGDFPDSSVRAALVAVLARLGGDRLEAARPLYDLMADEAGPAGRAVRLEAARLAQRLDLPFDDAIRRLIGDEDDEVACAAIGAVARRGAAPFVDAIARRLDDISVAPAAAEALVAAGASAHPALASVLSSPVSPPDARRAAASVLERMGGPAAASALADHLLDADASLRLRILTALDTMKASGPGVSLDPRPLEAALGAEILGHYRSYQILGTVDARNPDHAPIVTGLRAAMREELERIFRLLDLMHPQRDFRSAWVALQSGDRVIHDQALDLLESLLQPGLRHLLVPLVDPVVDERQRMALAQRLVGVPLDGPEAAVAALVGTGDPWLRSCAAYAIGALGLRSMRPQLESWSEDPDPLLRETVRQARARLDAAGS